DNVADLVGEQARVHRVQHTARAADTVVKFQVPVAVPRQRGDALARLDADCLQRVGDPFRTRRDTGPGSAVKRAFRIARNNLPITVPGRGVIDQARDQQRTLLHQTKHGCFPLVKPRREATQSARVDYSPSTKRIPSSTSVGTSLGPRRMIFRVQVLGTTSTDYMAWGPCYAARCRCQRASSAARISWVHPWQRRKELYLPPAVVRAPAQQHRRFHWRRHVVKFHEVEGAIQDRSPPARR